MLDSLLQTLYLLLAKIIILVFSMNCNEKLYFPFSFILPNKIYSLPIIAEHVKDIKRQIEVSICQNHIKEELSFELHPHKRDFYYD